MSDVPTTTELTILAPDQNPLDVLRTMAKFVSDNRGIAEIRDERPIVAQSSASNLIGMVVLCRQPEKTAVPIFDQVTREIEVCMLTDWLRQRGYDAAAARWHRRNNWVNKPDVEWELIVGESAMPPLPEPFPPLPFSTIMPSGGAVITVTNHGSGYLIPSQQMGKTAAIELLLRKYFFPVRK